MIEQGISQFLNDDLNIFQFFQGAIQSAPRVFGVMMPAKYTRVPAIVYSAVASHTIESVRGPNLLEMRRFQFDSFGRTYLESRILSRYVKQAFFPFDQDGNPQSLATVLSDGSKINSTRLVLDIDKPFESGEGGYIFCATLDIEIAFVNAV